MGMGYIGSSKVIQKTDAFQIGSINGASNTIFYDGAEQTLLLWTKNDIVGVGAIVRDTTTGIAGGIAAAGASVKITTGAGAGNTTEGFVNVGSKITTQLSGIVRISVAVKPAVAAANDGFYIYTSFRDGTNRKAFGIKFLATAASTGKLQYFNSGAAWTDITGVTFTLTDGSWNYCDLVMDVTNGKYLTFQIAGRSVTVAGLLPENTADTADYTQLKVGAVTGAAVAKSVYFDEYLIYQL
jgi:hypothetical protein